MSHPPSLIHFTSSSDTIGNVLRSAKAAIEKSSADFETARTIQDRLLPAHLPHVRDIECFGHCERCGKLGGDFFDFSSANSDELTAVIGNVGLTGTAGAILRTGVQTARRILAARGAELPDLAAEANRMLWEIAPDDAYATMFSARIGRRPGQLEYTSAGHQAALIVRNTGHVARLEPNAAVLGLSRTSVYRPRTVAFEPGDTLIAVSDGVSEIMNYQDTPRIRARELPARIIREVELSTGPGSIDRTVIVVRYGAGPVGLRAPVQHALAAA